MLSFNPIYMYIRVNKKTGISGILADFGNFFIPNVMATSIIENLTILQIFGFFTSRNFRSENSAKQAKKCKIRILTDF